MLGLVGCGFGLETSYVEPAWDAEDDMEGL